MSTQISDHSHCDHDFQIVGENYYKGVTLDVYRCSKCGASPPSNNTVEEPILPYIGCLVALIFVMAIVLLKSIGLL